MRSLGALLVLLTALGSPALAQQPAPNRVKTIQDIALARSSAYPWLEELTDSIGPRLTASPEASRAAQWALRKMEAIGLRDAHLETWQMRRGWQRISARAELIEPIHLPLSVASYGWTGSTAASGADSHVVLVNRDALAEEIAKSAAWAGKVVFLAPLGPKPANSLTVYSQLSRLVRVAEAAHAAAVIARDSRPGTMLLHTGSVSFDDESYAVPVLDIAAEHQKLLERLLKSGKPVRMRIAIENRFTPGPVESANVIAEIPGTENPEQVVMLGAHLDSWDLATGAIDDGYGVAAVLAAAEAIVASGQKPRRTIRLALFTGEEQGLLGSRAWVRRHRAEIGDVVCALVLDWGHGPITALPLAGHSELAAGFHGLSDIVNVTDGYLTFTDAFPFTLAGVPGLAFLQDTPDYTLLGHSAADTLDKVDARILERNTAVLAAAAFWIADLPSRPGSVWPADETARRLTQDGQRKLLETFGLWPFP